DAGREGSRRLSQMGCFISFSTWQALVVTELTPEHHSTEKSQGWFTTYKLTEILSRRYCLHRESLVSTADSGVPAHRAHSRRGPYVWDAIQHLQPRGRTSLESQTRGRFAGQAEDGSQLHPQPCLVGHAWPWWDLTSARPWDRAGTVP
uniref:Uncharacterized protein n=1 Tax=Anser brachyrhynchus TaxID=132585 RepID=A0A8B9CS66_9AVES